jgi:NADH-quinone oxidoreductase subunit C
MNMASTNTQLALLKAELASLVKKVNGVGMDVELVFEKKNMLSAFKALRDKANLAYTQLIDVCAVDYLGQKDKRFEVVYHLLSMDYNRRVRVKVALDDGESIPSLTGLFVGANWWERETFDMFGISFDGHPDLRRILSDYEFQGFPLRKDFPLTGYVQVRYDPEARAVVKEPVHLAQAYRTFETLSPWEGMGQAVGRSAPEKRERS